MLARLFVVDDERQHQSSKSFFGGRSPDDPAFISLIVVVELVWLLATTYQFRRPQILAVVTAILDSPDFTVERRDLVEEAVAIATKSNAGIADVAIALVSAAAGCSSTVTFDNEASKRIPGMELLK